MKQEKLTEKEKALQKELQFLIDKWGYWSPKVGQFNDLLDFCTMVKINNTVKK